MPDSAKNKIAVVARIVLRCRADFNTAVAVLDADCAGGFIKLDTIGIVGDDFRDRQASAAY